MNKTCTKCKISKSIFQFYLSDRLKHTYVCKPCKNAYKIQHRKNNPDKHKVWERNATIRRYGIDRDKYNTLYKNQEGKCAICKIDRKVLHIDHSYKTSKVRGLLCGKCNTGLGQFNDDKDILAAAIKYLELNG